MFLERTRRLLRTVIVFIRVSSTLSLAYDDLNRDAGSTSRCIVMDKKLDCDSIVAVLSVLGTALPSAREFLCVKSGPAKSH